MYASFYLLNIFWVNYNFILTKIRLYLQIGIAKNTQEKVLIARRVATGVGAVGFLLRGQLGRDT